MKEEEWCERFYEFFDEVDCSPDNSKICRDCKNPDKSAVSSTATTQAPTDKAVKKPQQTATAHKREKRPPSPPKKIKMSEIDRLEAMRRSSKYIHDYNSWPPHEPKWSIYKKEMINKWGIDPRFFPEPLKPYIYRRAQKIGDHYYNNTVEEVSSIDPERPPIEKKYTEPLDIPIDTEIPIEAENNSLSPKEIVELLGGRITGIEGRYLYLRIDITEDETTILEQVKSIIKGYQAFLPKDTGREKKIKRCDIWEVYDLKKLDGLDIAVIARRLFGYDHPSSSDDPDYKAVSHAYNRAVELIEQVEMEARERVKLKSA